MFTLRYNVAVLHLIKIAAVLQSAATALHWAVNSVKKGGVVSIVGVYGPIQTLVPIGNVVNKGITIRANQALDSEFTFSRTRRSSTTPRLTVSSRSHAGSIQNSTRFSSPTPCARCRRKPD